MLKNLERSKFGLTIKKMDKHMNEMYTKITKKKIKKTHLASIREEENEDDDSNAASASHFSENRSHM